jgi:predicted alpha/beta-hydrolase family hydrolase
MPDELALARAEQCRRIAEQYAATPIARENWYYLAEHWEQAARREPRSDRKSLQRHWQTEPHNLSQGGREF